MRDPIVGVLATALGIMALSGAGEIFESALNVRMVKFDGWNDDEIITAGDLLCDSEQPVARVRLKRE